MEANKCTRMRVKVRKREFNDVRGPIWELSSEDYNFIVQNSKSISLVLHINCLPVPLRIMEHS